MAKVKTLFQCQQCSFTQPRWTGQCSNCQAWNSFVEETVVPKAVTGFGKNSSLATSAATATVERLSTIKSRKKRDRITTGSEEFDRVLGGGLVAGSVVLVGGEPGIGKSTLLTQMAIAVGSSATKSDSDVNQQELLYICGEESVEQVSLRVERLAANPKQVTQVQDSIGFVSSSNIDAIIATAREKQPQVMIVDSIQTVHTTDLTGMAGSVGQVRECCFRLIELAKQEHIAIVIVGHVTKDGQIAGPKVLEHMVDAVIQITGERTGMWRLLKSVKNRFGTTHEVGVCEMTAKGLLDVKNPSGAFLEDGQEGQPGSVITAVMEGSRPVLLEIQALVVKSQLAMPRRVVHGIKLSKLQVLCAVLQKSGKLSLGDYDVFVNVIGGLQVDEPAADLAICMAITSSYKNKKSKESSVIFGEVGLLGEIRRVPFLEERITAAKRLGYAKTITPKSASHISSLLKKNA